MRAPPNDAESAGRHLCDAAERGALPQRLLVMGTPDLPEPSPSGRVARGAVKALLDEPSLPDFEAFCAGDPSRARRRPRVRRPLRHARAGSVRGGRVPRRGRAARRSARARLGRAARARRARVPARAHRRHAAALPRRARRRLRPRGRRRRLPVALSRTRLARGRACPWPRAATRPTARPIRGAGSPLPCSAAAPAAPRRTPRRPSCPSRRSRSTRRRCRGSRRSGARGRGRRRRRLLPARPAVARRARASSE